MQGAEKSGMYKKEKGFQNGHCFRSVVKYLYRCNYIKSATFSQEKTEIKFCG